MVYFSETASLHPNEHIFDEMKAITSSGRSNGKKAISSLKVIVQNYGKLLLSWRENEAQMQGAKDALANLLVAFRSLSKTLNNRDFAVHNEQAIKLVLGGVYLDMETTITLMERMR